MADNIQPENVPAVVPVVVPPPAVEPSSSAPDASMLKPTPANNPLRRPSWRWDRIEYLSTKTASGLRKPAVWDDDYVKMGRKYIVHYKNMLVVNQTGNMARDADVLSQIMYTQWPDLSMAHNIYSGKNFARWAIEALVLAQVRAEDIAADLGCPPSVIEMYEKLFYDIRDRIGHETFILDAVMSPMLKSGATPNDYDFFWKGIGYWYGASMLRALWSLGTLDESIRKQLAECVSGLMLKNTLKASVSRIPNQYNSHEIMEEQLLADQQKKGSEDEGDTPQAMAKKGAAVLMEAVQFTLASAKSIGSEGTEPRVISALQPIMQLAGMKPPAQVEMVPTPPDNIYERKKDEPIPVTPQSKAEHKAALNNKKSLLLQRLRGKK